MAEPPSPFGDPEAPPVETDEPTGEAASGDLVDQAEHLADRTIERFKGKVHLPDVRAEYGRVAAFFRSIHSGTLWLVLGLYMATAAAGVGVALVGIEPIGALPDWFMHAAMYVVIFSFLILYVKAHLMHRRLARGFFALVTLAQLAFFAWVLLDLVERRSIVVGGAIGPDVVERPTMSLLQVPAVLLMVTGGALLVHWLVLSRYRKLDADAAQAAQISAETAPAPSVGIQHDDAAEPVDDG